ncbi:hypothetical protein Agub_g8428 [Astrephomene gubernaculifera]|uniref:Calcium-dependent protein kinase n=1 Tax=Astrephomene gubernaculifera TaxID=47775 RepID=A0AAD3DRP1_9CHLO|nr:hypothetical protein Agub_g8428 [Astrephomene gubernaculifera]
MGCGASQPAAGPAREFSAVLDKVPSMNMEDMPLPVKSPWVFKGRRQNVKDHYTFGELLGKGTYGTCRIVTDRLTGRRYACKSIPKSRLATTKDVQKVKREVAIMEHLEGHPNIVAIENVFEDRKDVHIVQELCSGGELFDSILEHHHYSERHAATAFRAIARIVAHCHSMGVMHRDIKPENFLLSSRDKDATIKGTDFGLSCFFKEGQTFKEVVGSPFYVAPEVLRRCYDKRADIWSLGVLLYIMLCGVPPYYGDTEKDTFKAILGAELAFDFRPWPSISHAAKDVIRRMLERDPAKRATAAEVLSHEWVREDGTAAAEPLSHDVLPQLRNFAALNKLQQEAIKVIATHLPENEISGLKALFMEINAAGSGCITVDELREALRKKGTRVSPDELRCIMAQADFKRDGTLDYEEFLAATMNLSKLEHDEHLYMAFRFFDKHDVGYITRERLAAVLHKSPYDPEIEELLQQADRNGDGRIDYNEFRALMRSGSSNISDSSSVLNKTSLARSSVEKGLMRRVRPHAVLDLQKLRVESVSPYECPLAARYDDRLPPIAFANRVGIKGIPGTPPSHNPTTSIGVVAPLPLLPAPRRLPPPFSPNTAAHCKGALAMITNGTMSPSSSTTSLPNLAVPPMEV